MALLACIDESGHADGPYYVLGGLMASPERWEAFSVAWDNELKADISLEYAHAVEANGLRDQFAPDRGWSKELRDAKLSRLCDIIITYAACRIHVSMDVLKFKEVVRPKLSQWAKFNDRPYWLLFHKLVLGLIVLQCSGAGVPVPIDFIFDIQKNIGDEAASEMLSILENLKSQTLPNGIQPKAFIKSSPVFRDDKEFLPLQAADLYAWSVSRCFNLKPKDERPLAVFVFEGLGPGGHLHAHSLWRLRKPKHLLNFARMFPGERGGSWNTIVRSGSYKLDLVDDPVVFAGYALKAQHIWSDDQEMIWSNEFYK